MPAKPPPLPDFSRYALEKLGREHDRKSFHSGLESVDRYLKEVARGHLEKGLSVTRVLVEKEAKPPKPIAGFFTLTICETLLEASWKGVPKGLPKRALPAVLLGRLAVSSGLQGSGLGSALVESAIHQAAQSMSACGGVGMIVDAANEEVICFYEKFGFIRTMPGAMRMFLPAAALMDRL